MRSSSRTSTRSTPAHREECAARGCLHAAGPKTQKPYPDHALRMEAAGHLIDLHGGKPREVEMPSEPTKGITINFYKESSAKVAVVVNPTGRTSIIPEGETKHPKLPVTFVKANGST